MDARVRLMYLEGEIKGGRITGRTILVIQTEREIDPKQPGYSRRDLQRFVNAACLKWEECYQPTDLVRLDYIVAGDTAHDTLDARPLSVTTSRFKYGGAFR
jgi:hypothetical protein